MQPLMSHEQRLKFLIYTPVALAPLSMAGSFLTLLTIYRTRCKDGFTRLMTYHRLLLGVSILDLVFSFGFGLGPFLLPRDQELAVIRNSYGNTATCTFQAFLLVLGHGSFCYNMMLMFYYLLIIRYGLKDDFLRSRVEPFMHLLTLGFYLGTATAGPFLEVFNPAGGICYVAGKPFGCEDLSDVPCQRGGEHAHFFHLWLAVAPLIATTILLLLTLVVLAVTVWWRNRQRQRFVFEKGLGYGSAHDSVDRRSQMVISQCFLYGITMGNCILWTSIIHIWALRHDLNVTTFRYYWMNALATIFFPLQGLFNFLIFLRPRYLSIRLSHPDLSRLGAAREAVLYPVDSREEREFRRLQSGQTLQSSGNDLPSLRQDSVVRASGAIRASSVRGSMVLIHENTTATSTTVVDDDGEVGVTISGGADEDTSSDRIAPSPPPQQTSEEEEKKKMQRQSDAQRRQENRNMRSMYAQSGFLATMLPPSEAFT